MIIAFTEAVGAAIASYTGKTITREYILTKRPAEILNGNWFVMSAGETLETTAHSNSISFEVYLVYQRALPKAATENPIQNKTFLDGCMTEVEAMKNLFRNPDDAQTVDSHTGKFCGCGVYGVISNYTFSSFTNDPLFDAVLLRDNHVFSSVIRLTYRG